MVRIIATDRAGKTHEIDATAGQPLMHCLNEQSDVEATCGGVASCGTCHIYVEGAWADKLPPRKEDEKILLDGQLHCRENSRISCQIPVTDQMDGLTLTIAPGE